MPQNLRSSQGGGQFLMSQVHLYDLVNRLEEVIAGKLSPNLAVSLSLHLSLSLTRTLSLLLSLSFASSLALFMSLSLFPSFFLALCICLSLSLAPLLSHSLTRTPLKPCRPPPPVGVVTGCQNLDNSTHLPRWRELVVFANK